MTIDLGFLAQAQALNDSVLIDRCIVRRDPQGTTDDAVDPNTLALIPPGSDSSTVYTGPCLLGKASQRVSRDREGQQDIYRRVVKIRFPITADRLRAGDLVEMTASPDPNSNAQLVDQRFRIFDVNDRSIAAGRIVLAEDETGARPR